MGRLTPPIVVRLSDQDAERVRANHEQRIAELAALPTSGYAILPSIVLKDSVVTAIPHKLGRTPVWCRSSDVRAATAAAITATGRVVMLARDAQYVTYLSVGWGADVAVDLEVG